jgi:hypothetical protein
MPVTAQRVMSAPADIPAFRSFSLMVDCVAQFTMGNKDTVNKAVARGEVFIVPKGTTVMPIEMDPSGVFTFMVKGRPGLWYSSLEFFE